MIKSNDVSFVYISVLKKCKFNSLAECKGACNIVFKKCFDVVLAYKNASSDIP